MSVPEKLEFFWPETGRLEIEFINPRCALVRYRPSEKVVDQMLQEFTEAAKKPIQDGEVSKPIGEP